MSNENKLSTAPAGAVAQKTAGGGALSVFADGASFNTALRMAQCLASSTVVPKEYHGNVGNCMIAIEMASRINTSPMMVMQNLYIVNGRPAWSSQWIIAMINSSRRYKTELQFEFGRDKADGGLSCRAWAEDYSGHKVYGPKITMNMANDEGWTSKNGSKWKTMPDVMIQYRAASFFGRMNCPDMINFQGVDFWTADHPPVKHIDTREKIDWFELFLSRMRDYSDGEVWGNGDELMCKTEAIADAMCDLLFQLYAAQGEEVVFHTGYYDPAEDARSGEEDRCTGWWYVDCD